MTINELITSWKTAGIFTYLDNYDTPWKDDIDSAYLNTLYHGLHSGNKTVSPLLENFMSSDGTITSANLDLIAHSIFIACGKNWTKMWATLNQTYTMINNYDMSETYSENIVGNGTQTGTGTVAKTGTDNTSITNTRNTSDSSTANSYGYNSSTATPTSSSSESGTVSDSGANNETLNLTDTETRNFADSESKSTVHTLSRSGNIGVTTSQQMIESERDLWSYYFFIDTVFKDIDKALTISVY